MNRYKLVVFDFDGTVADTSEGIFNSIRYVERKMNLPEITAEQMRSYVGPPVEESYSRNFGLIGEDLKKAVAYHKEYAVKQGYRELRIYDGILELLKMLRDKGYLTAVATLKAQDTVEKIVDCFKIKKDFDFVAGVTVPTSKSELISRCMAELHCRAEETVLIGDSEYDALGAREAGADFIAVTYGYGFASDEDVNVYKAVGVASSVKEIFEII